jgi:hypothetical protein
MHNSPVMRLLLACSLVVGPLPAPAFPQAVPKQSAAAESKEAADFRKFVAQHPKALAELKKDPSLISKPAFSKDHPVVGRYIAAHPNVKEIVKANPDFFANLTATTPGGEHGQKKKSGEKKQ